MEELVEVLPTAEEVEAQNEKVNSAIEKFTADNVEFNKMYAQSAEMIRGFDESLTNKANKVQMIKEF